MMTEHSKFLQARIVQLEEALARLVKVMRENDHAGANFAMSEALALLASQASGEGEGKRE